MDIAGDPISVMTPKTKINSFPNIAPLEKIAPQIFHEKYLITGVCWFYESFRCPRAL
jgi:hypothetical protein